MADLLATLVLGTGFGVPGGRNQASQDGREILRMHYMSLDASLRDNEDFSRSAKEGALADLAKEAFEKIKLSGRGHDDVSYSPAKDVGVVLTADTENGVYRDHICRFNDVAHENHQIGSADINAAIVDHAHNYVLNRATENLELNELVKVVPNSLALARKVISVFGNTERKTQSGNVLSEAVQKVVDYTQEEHNSTADTYLRTTREGDITDSLDAASIVRRVDAFVGAVRLYHFTQESAANGYDMHDVIPQVAVLAEDTQNAYVDLRRQMLDHINAATNSIRNATGLNSNEYATVRDEAVGKINDVMQLSVDLLSRYQGIEGAHLLSAQELHSIGGQVNEALGKYDALHQTHEQRGKQ